MNASARLPKVYIVTWCRNAELLYGATLIFATLRTGFPDCEVVVVENASPPELRGPIHKAAGAAGCRVVQLEKEWAHWALIEKFVMDGDQPTVILDSDIVLWERVSEWDFGDALMAGRFLPEFADSFSDTLTLSRLHSSHLWFPRPAELRTRIQAIRQRRFEFGKPVRAQNAATRLVALGYRRGALPRSRFPGGSFL